MRSKAQIDGADETLRRTGIYRREDHLTQGEEFEEERESSKPDTLPERSSDGTTGMVNVDAEGNDRAPRENHPRR